MKIGLFINNFYQTQSLKDPGVIATTLAKLGHTLTIYCLETDLTSASFDIPIKKISPAELNSDIFWATEDNQVIIIYSWLSLRYTKLIKILRLNKIKIILKLDSDGHLIYPLRPSYLRVFGLTNSLKAKLIHLTRLLLWLLFPKTISRLKIKQIIQADALIIESPLAQKNLQQSLQYWQHADLSKKIFFIPNPLNINSENNERLANKENLIVSIGRWADRRKNGDGLIKILSNFKSSTNWNFLIIGAGANKLKKIINKNNPLLKITAAEKIDHPTLLEYLKSSKIFLAPSRADSFNLAAAEALGAGASLAATPLESFIYFSANGRFGTISKNIEANTILMALEAEIIKWEQNLYNPQITAANWQTELNPTKIGRDLENLIKSL